MGTKYISQTLSQSIVTHLRKKGMTLKQIGDLMGVSESFVSYVKSGDRNFTITRLRKLEKALKQPLPLLFLETVDATSIPKELAPQYEALRKVLHKSAALRKMVFGVT